MAALTSWCFTAACLLLSLAVSEANVQDVLFEHNFLGTTHGWNTVATVPNTVSKFQLSTTGHGLEGSDTSKRTWYFNAPIEAMGDKSAAYNGWLILTFGHRTYNAEGKGPQEGFDVILESKGQRLKIGAKNFFGGSNYWGRVKAYSLKLHESNFLNTTDSTAISKEELIRVLYSLSTFKVRGSFFEGSETATLVKLQFVEGPSNYEAGQQLPGTPRRNKVTVPRACTKQDVYTMHSTYALDNTIFQFTHVPVICSAATLTVRTFTDNFVDETTFAELVDGHGNSLGRIWNTAYQPDEAVPFEGSIVLNADTMARLSAPGVMTFHIVDSAASMRKATGVVFHSASLKYRPTACDVHTSSGPLTNDLYDGNITLSRVQPTISDTAFALYFVGPSSQDRTVGAISLSIFPTNGSSAQPLISVGANTHGPLPVTFDDAHVATIALDDISQFLHSDGTFKLHLRAESMIDGTSSTKRWFLQTIGAAKNCFSQQIEIHPWFHQTPSQTRASSKHLRDRFAVPWHSMCSDGQSSCGHSSAVQHVGTIDITSAPQPTQDVLVTGLGIAASSLKEFGKVSLYGTEIDSDSTGVPFGNWFDGNMPATTGFQTRCTPTDSCKLSIISTAHEGLVGSILVDRSKLLEQAWTGDKTLWYRIGAISTHLVAVTISYPSPLPTE